MNSQSFLAEFDDEGCYRHGSGTLDVTFQSRAGTRYPGRLHFANGLCVRAQMDGGGDWSHPGAPLTELRLSLAFDGEAALGVAIDRGRVFGTRDKGRISTRADFLNNVRVARNLLAHAPNGSPAGAVWLTPRTVAGFALDDFPELGAERGRELATAVNTFLAVALGTSPSDEQLRVARTTFQTICDILNRYLPVGAEASLVENALRPVQFPDWVASWDFELAPNSLGDDSIWIDLYTEAVSWPPGELGSQLFELSAQLRAVLATHGLARQLYLRVRAARAPLAIK
jgi:hypothetical protein